MPTSCKSKILIVGAGISGATIARVLAEKNFNVHVIDKRDHIAGNTYDYINKNNERIHKYGPHLLHCNKDSEALKFLSRYTDWIKYEHKVTALLKDGRTTPLPINQKTLEDIFHKKFSDEKEVKDFLNSLRNRKIIPKNTDQFFEASVGNKLADIFFRPYTKKMWGVHPSKLSVRIGSRLPIRTDLDCRYFNDNFQALPKNGYTKLISNILDHKNIELNLNENFQKEMESKYDFCFLCIPIDKYFDYKFGILPYRSIIFENRIEYGNDLSSPVVNFTDELKYTRKTQWSLLPNSPHPFKEYRTITYEIPCSMNDNPGEYYYPVQTKKSEKLYEKYNQLAKKNTKIFFCGRTGLFKYLDMIPAVQKHLKIADDFIKM
tara:strand:- start:6829 stop:7956 length:1128 start_codon:yes stop_codon:yes gene_type:complete